MRPPVNTAYCNPKRGFRLLSSMVRTVAITIAALALGSSISASSSMQDAYRLGPEDTIDIKVLGHQDFSGEFVVLSDGHIDVPVVGSMDVCGRTTDELALLLTEELKNRLREPEVTVSLRTPRPQLVYVIGDVGKPGPYDLKPGWRVAEVLAAAGGLLPQTEPTDCLVTICRKTGKRESANLTELMKGTASSALSIESGDVITIGSGEKVPVYVMGKVRNPGLYKIRKTEAGAMQAVTVAGGALDDAALANISVRHLTGQSETVDLTPTAVNGQQVEKVALQAGDLIVVPENTARIAVLGLVGEPGLYSLRDGQQVTLSDALGMAKGTSSRRARINAIAVMRTEGGKLQRTTYNLREFLGKGDVTQNPGIRAGDIIYVPETGKIDWDVLLRMASSVDVLMNPLLR